MPVKPADYRATRTIKISRLVHQHLSLKATLSEPFDRTLRRELGLKLQKGEFLLKDVSPGKGSLHRRGGKPLSEWTTGKISEDTWGYITSRAEWNESVDHTLRRLLKLDQLEVQKK